MYLRNMESQNKRMDSTQQWQTPGVEIWLPKIGGRRQEDSSKVR